LRRSNLSTRLVSLKEEFLAESWKLDGIYMEACNCRSACPCVFLSPLTEGECTALVAWHIGEGRCGGVKLDGLNVAVGNSLAGDYGGIQMEIRPLP
jgi:hypothetical protein